MDDKKKSRRVFSGINLKLLGIAVLLFAVGVLLFWASPVWWGYYLTALDVRAWPPWKGIGLLVVLAEGLLAIRFWPNESRRQPEESTGDE